MTFETAVADQTLNGESPLWSWPERALYWVDTWRERIYRLEFDSGRRSEWSVPSKIAAVGLRAGGGLVVAMRGAIAFLDTTTGTLEHRVDPEPGHPENRLNDGKTDRAGRFWFASMEHVAQQPVGKLFRFSPDGELAALADGLVLPNGPAWSPDDRTMYLADSRRECIYAYDFDIDEGVVRNRRVFAEVPRSEGVPDGATVDTAGCLWSARAGGWTIARYTPAGKIDRIVKTPVARPTSVMFGGDDFRTLYVTTSRTQLDEATVAAQPLAGTILAMRTDIDGMPEPAYAG